MAWIRLRSRRDPAVWAPILLVVLLACALAAWGQLWMTPWLEAFESRSKADPEGTVSEAVRVIRLCEIALFATSAFLGAFLFRFFQLGLRESRIPPEGWWSLGAWRAMVGPHAARMGRIGLLLSPLLPRSAIAIVWILERLLHSLLSGGGAG